MKINNSTATINAKNQSIFDQSETFIATSNHKIWLAKKFIGQTQWVWRNIWFQKKLIIFLVCIGVCLTTLYTVRGESCCYSASGSPLHKSRYLLGREQHNALRGS